jgi:hypothetical protein
MLDESCGNSVFRVKALKLMERMLRVLLCDQNHSSASKGLSCGRSAAKIRVGSEAGSWESQFY